MYKKPGHIELILLELIQCVPVFLFSLLICPKESQAALTVVQHVNNFINHTGSATDLNSISTTITATGGNNLLVAGVIVATPANSVTQVTDGTNSFLPFPGATAFSSAYGFRTDVWYLPKSTAGKTTITVNTGALSQFLSLEVWEVSGFKNPTFDVTGLVVNGTSASSTDTGAAVTTTTTNGFVIGEESVGGNGVSANPKAGNEFTSGGDVDCGGNGIVSLISTTAASHQPLWTDSDPDGNSFTETTAAFKENTSVMRKNSTTGFS